jgi:hypothetical protein
MGLLEVTLLYCRAFYPTGVVVELLWTLRSHSLVQSEDQAELSPLWVIQKTKLRGYPLIISTSLSSSLEVLHLMVASLYHSALQFSTIPFCSGNLPGCCTSSKNVYLALFLVCPYQGQDSIQAITILLIAF